MPVFLPADHAESWMSAGVEEAMAMLQAIEVPPLEIRKVDRTIINIKPEHVDAWLPPEGRTDEELFAIFDDRRHPYYELVKQAA